MCAPSLKISHSNLIPHLIAFIFLYNETASAISTIVYIIISIVFHNFEDSFQPITIPAIESIFIIYFRKAVIK